MNLQEFTRVDHSPTILKTREPYVWNDGIERERRPIDRYLPEVLRKMAESQVVIVEAETGVGKTTRIPQAISDSDPAIPIIETQPRRLAVRMNAHFIAQEMHCEPGGKVGWKLKGEPPTVSDQTQLILMVDQSLTNQIRREGKLPQGVLIIDEAHERSVQTDVLLALIKRYLPDSPDTKVIITSATLDTQKFRDFFDAAEPVIAFNETTYPVEVRPVRLHRGEHHTEGAIRAAKTEILDVFAQGELTILTVDPESTGRLRIESGTVLVLLPGKDDIREAIREIKNYAQELDVQEKVEVLACHGQMDPEEQRLIENTVPPGTLRFICATDVIRSSVTVDGVIGVIDSLQVKRHFTDKNGVTHLQKINISGAEAEHGKGRAGRQRPGFYLPVSFENDYERITERDSPEYWPQPAIQREALSSVVLQFASVGLNIRNLDMLDKPPQEKIDVAIKRLQQLGALDDGEQITKLGQQLVEFPIEPERAMVLLEAEKRGILPEALIVMSVLENEGILRVPRKDKERVMVNRETLLSIINSESILGNLPEWVKIKPEGRYELDCTHPAFPLLNGARGVTTIVWRQFAQETNSDFYAAVAAYRAFKNRETALDLQSLRTWCDEHFLNYKQLRLVEATIRDLLEEADNAGLHFTGAINPPRDFSSDDLTKSLLSGLADGLSKLSGRGSYSGPKASYLIPSKTSACSQAPKFVLAENVRKVTTAGGKLVGHFSDMIAPVDPEWLLEIAPKRCLTNILESSAAYNQTLGRVQVTKQTFLGDLLIKEEWVEASGELAVTTFAEALAQENLNLPFMARNKQVIHELNDFWNRSEGTIGAKRFEKHDLKDWYKERLGDICSKAELVEALETGQINLTLDLDDFVTPQERGMILDENPSTITVNGNEYPIHYEYLEGFSQKPFVAFVKIPASEIIHISQKPELPSGRSLEIWVVKDPQAYFSISTGTDLSELRKKARDYLVDQMYQSWIKGPDAPHQEEQLYFNLLGELPRLPEPVSYGVDPLTNEALLAYPALTRESSWGRDKYVIKYYQTRDEAHLTQGKVEEAMRMARIYEQKQKERAQFDEPARQALEEASELMGRVTLANYPQFGLTYANRLEMQLQLSRARTAVYDDPRMTLNLLNPLLEQLRQVVKPEEPQTVAEVDLPPEGPLRISKYLDLSKLETPELAELLTHEVDIGQKNLLIAALATKGPAGIEELLTLRITDKKVLASAKKAMAIALREVRRRAIPDYPQMTQIVDNVERALKLYEMVLATDRHTLVAEIIGNDQEAQVRFRRGFYEKLALKKKLPDIDMLEPLINTVLEEMTS